MKRPLWLMVVGLLMIILGVLGLVSGVQEILMPKTLALQQESIQQMKKMMAEHAKQPEATQNPQQPPMLFEPDGFIDLMEKFSTPPQWYTSWAPLIGSIILLVNVLYLVGGIVTVMVKRYAVPVLYSALCLSLLWSVSYLMVCVLSDNAMLMVRSFGLGTGIAIDIALLITVFMADKKIFHGFAADNATTPVTH